MDLAADRAARAGTDAFMSEPLERRGDSSDLVKRD